MSGLTGRIQFETTNQGAITMSGKLEGKVALSSQSMEVI